MKIPKPAMYGQQPRCFAVQTTQLFVGGAYGVITRYCLAPDLPNMVADV